jgi:lantibiotic modifying enzyme
VPYLGDPARETGSETVEMTQSLDDSILRTAILPLISSAEAEVDYSAFAAIGEQATDYRLPRWENINTDRMEVVFEKARISPGQNVPKLEGVNLNLAEHSQDLGNGFEEMYRFVLNKRADLLAENSPLRKFAGLCGRFLFRNTRIYGLLLVYSAQPCYLREGIDRSLHFEKLSRAFLLDESRPVFWPLLELEKQSLEQLDIPLFECNTSRKELVLGKESAVSGWFTACGYQAVLACLQGLDELDLSRQQAVIREALRSWFAGEPFKLENLLSDSRPLVIT